MTVSSAMSEVLVIEEIPCENGDGVIAKVTINRPDKLNALNQDVTSSIKEMCKWAEENDSIRCVVITGAKPNPPPEGKRVSLTHSLQEPTSPNSLERVQKKLENYSEIMQLRRFGI